MTEAKRQEREQRWRRLAHDLVYACKTITAVLENLHIPRSTYYSRWRAKPGFQALYKAEMRRQKAEHRAEMRRAVAEIVKRANAAYARKLKRTKVSKSAYPHVRTRTRP